MENPTWREVAKVVDDSIPIVNDRHHIYLESFKYAGIDPLTETALYYPIMGS